MHDSNDLARLAIVVSAAVALLAPLLATVVQASLARRARTDEQRQKHEGWLRDRRSEVYARAVGVARKVFLEARAAIGEGLDPGTDVDPLELRRLDGDIRVFASANVRDAFLAIYMIETEAMITGKAWSEGRGAIEAARAAVERLSEAIERFSDLVAVEIQQVAP